MRKQEEKKKEINWAVHPFFKWYKTNTLNICPDLWLYIYYDGLEMNAPRKGSIFVKNGSNI